MGTQSEAVRKTEGNKDIAESSHVRSGVNDTAGRCLGERTGHK